jgi:hypothetical protein
MKIWFIIALLLVPVFAVAETVHVPKDHFLGISEPCRNLHGARKQAIHDIASQVLRSIGASYSLESSSSVTGSDKQVVYNLSEKFQYSASGFIHEIERRVVDEKFEKTAAGIVYRMLVHFTPAEIETMRRLSLGAKVHAVWLADNLVEIRELNGVPVTLSEYTIQLDSRNAHAGFLSYYVVKVPAGDSTVYRHAFQTPLNLRSGVVKRVRLKMPDQNKTGFQELVLGTRKSMKVTLNGTDSVGRSIQAVVR